MQSSVEQISEFFLFIEQSHFVLHFWAGVQTAFMNEFWSQDSKRILFMRKCECKMSFFFVIDYVHFYSFKVDFSFYRK